GRARPPHDHHRRGRRRRLPHRLRRLAPRQPRRALGRLRPARPPPRSARLRPRRRAPLRAHPARGGPRMSASLAPDAPRRGLLPVARDYIALTKPAINRMCLLMAAGGLFLARGHTPTATSLDLATALFGLLGTALAVASANALNMWLERDSD